MFNRLSEKSKKLVKAYIMHEGYKALSSFDNVDEDRIDKKMDAILSKDSFSLDELIEMMKDDEVFFSIFGELFVEWLINNKRVSMQKLASFGTKKKKALKNEFLKWGYNGFMSEQS